MRIAIAADHAGFALKERLRQKLAQSGHQLTDHGTTSEEAVDYPDYAAAVARDVAKGSSERGLLVCGSGAGMVIAANKIPGIRAALATNPEEVRLTRSHNDANVLSVGSRFMSEDEAVKLIDIFLNTAFDGGRHARRVEKIHQLELEGR